MRSFIVALILFIGIFSAIIPSQGYESGKLNEFEPSNGQKSIFNMNISHTGSVTKDWEPLLQKLHDSADATGKKLVKQLIGLLVGFEDALKRGDKAEILRILRKAGEILTKLIPHLNDPELKVVVIAMGVQRDIVIELYEKDGDINRVIKFLDDSALDIRNIYEHVKEEVIEKIESQK